MSSSSKNNDVGEQAAVLFGNGYHCAESIVVAVLEACGENGKKIAPMATPFGGGFAESFAEVCGVVSGSMLVIGCCHGRNEQGASWNKAADLGREFIEIFRSAHGTLNCGKLVGQVNEEEQMNHCRNIVRSGAICLMEVLGKASEYSDKQHVLR